ncbi:MAG: TldD/PmbA family protein [Gammaproteobacteria bacterium]|nr:TldD/PmbA family protein [Gammaproteobacteria bacterium]
MAAIELVERCLEALKQKGFDKTQVRLITAERHELQAEFNKPSLLRTVHDNSLALAGIVDGKRGSVTLNKQDDRAVEQAIDTLWNIAQGSIADEANDISESQPPQQFKEGPEAPDYEVMYARLDELLQYTSSTYPTITMGSALVDHGKYVDVLANSNGVQFSTTRGRYGAQLMFTARDEGTVSSFNFTGFALNDMETPIAEIATTDTLLRQITEQIHTKKVPDKFVGDLVITPDCLGSFLSFLTGNISGLPMIAGTSLYKNKLGEQVAAEMFSMHSRPLDLAGGYFVTDDGYTTENTTIIENGKLRTYLLNLYGARKTGLDRARTGGGCYVVDPGEQSLESMIGDVKRGILITRFSGGRPNDRGDFSGVAKNSYYIENGKPQYPVSETMISGNMADLLKNIVGVSVERADFGIGIYPWVRTTGVGIS